jgi:hypothetical protein
MAQIDAGVAGQILRHLRRRALCEIRRRGHRQHSHVRSDAHRDHVLRDLLAKADAGVVPVRDNIRQGVVDDEFDIDVGVVRQEFLKLRPEDRVRRMLGGRDADVAGRLVAKFAQRGQLGVDFRKARGQRLQQALAGFSRGHAPRGAGQQPQAQACLESANDLAQRRLRHPELGRGLGEAAFAGDGDEGDEVVVVLAGHSMAPGGIDKPSL